GYCFLISPDMLDGARRNIAMQQGLCIDTVLHERSSLPEHLPDMNPDGVAAIAYERIGGFADPVRATEAYVNAFVGVRGEGRPRTPVRGLTRSNDRVTGIVVEDGPIGAGWVVVNAAGPWAKPLAESAGLELALRALREQDTVWEIPRGRPIPTVSMS